MGINEFLVVIWQSKPQLFLHPRPPFIKWRLASRHMAQGLEIRLLFHAALVAIPPPVVQFHGQPSKPFVQSPLRAKRGYACNSL